jgi:hypothetical protein
MNIPRTVRQLFIGIGIGGLMAACSGPQLAPAAANSRISAPAQAACDSLVPASQGGPLPSGDVAVLRWLGTANFELAYHGKIVIMDTFYERPARTAALGFTVAQVKKADVILIGHAHADHISDVAPVAARTGAPVVGSAITTTQAIALGVPQGQTITVAGNETLHYGDITIRPTHVIHSTIENGLIPALAALYKVDAPPLTAAEQLQSAAVLARGSRDPNLVTEGTMGFTFILPGGFSIVWFDSVGDPNAEERALASELAPIDVGIFPWTPHPIAATQLAYTFQHLQLFRPRLYIPDHHDSIWGVWLDNGLAPLFMKIRDDLPETKFIEPLYRSAICINTSGKERGAYYQGR